MNRIPEPDHTPNGPAYEGRLLDRVDEEVVDQGARFDIGTILSRRGPLSIVGLGAGTAVLAACAPSASATSSPTASPTASASASATSAPAAAVPAGEIPDETAGPYPGDGSNGPDILNQSGVVRSDIRTSIGGGATAAGVPITLNLTILDQANGDAPVRRCRRVCVALRRRRPVLNVLGRRHGRDIPARRAGRRCTGHRHVHLDLPACYSGRWPHIHFEVHPDAAAITDASNAIATSQVAMPQAACETVYALSDYSGSSGNRAKASLASDNVFGDDGGELELASVTGDTARGYTVALTVRVDTTTTPTAGASPGSR